MTVRVERTVRLDAPREKVWEFISDAEKRASPISVVEDFELVDDRRANWFLRLPIPVINRTIRVETEERKRDPPKFVEFVGKSKVMRVVGTHKLAEDGDGTELMNRFVVEGKLPGVERFFKRNMDAEFDNLEDALDDYLGLSD
jgi:carbon monoxide dehydrogenase subunit G